jgi:hypothetical protein
MGLQIPVVAVEGQEVLLILLVEVETVALES